jgi:hypothetical protein
MKLIERNEHLEAEHGIIAASPDDFYGYYGWPTVARMPDGVLVAAASGLRNAHVCPFGRSVFFRSQDEGRTWTAPRVINDSPLDDRDTGMVSCGDDRLLLTWFSTDLRTKAERRMEGLDDDTRARWNEGLRRVDDEVASRWVGAWARTSENAGETWSDPIRVPQTTPHGPIRRQSGDLLFLGKLFETDMTGFEGGVGSIVATRSDDAGRTWEPLGTVPLFEGSVEQMYHEAHVAELADGKLVGLIRFEQSDDITPEDLGLLRFIQMYTESIDGGRTWTRCEPMNFHGCPPHLLLHSSGALVGTYGRRLEPFGERAMISRDGGGTWEYDYILRDDGLDSDLGYPSSVELDDGSILTAYYQKPERASDRCGFLWSRWRLPDR